MSLGNDNEHQFPAADKGTENIGTVAASGPESDGTVRTGATFSLLNS
jgi:hypothetical protein